MASKSSASLAFFLALNLLFFALASACGNNCAPSTPKSSMATCPRDALKLGVCTDLLGGLLGLNIGNPSNKPCCTIIQGLADLDAAVCLCTAIRAKVLRINLNVPLSLSLLLNVCGKKVPSGFQCA